MKLIVCGPRDFPSQEFVFKCLDERVWAIDEIVHGAHWGGVDKFADEWSKSRNCPCKQFPADWKKLGKAAGPIRNAQMAAYGDAVLAIRHKESAGTNSMIEEGRKAGLPVKIIDYVETPA